MSGLDRSQFDRVEINYTLPKQPVIYEELDKVYMNEKTNREILDWCGENRWAWSLRNAPIEKGMFIFTDGYNKPKGASGNALEIFFELLPEYILFFFEPMKPDQKFMWVVQYDMKIAEDQSPIFQLGFPEKFDDEDYLIATNITGLWCSVMSYIREFRGTPQVQQSTHRSARKKKPKKGTNKKRVTYINKTVYRLSGPPPKEEQEKKEITRHAVEPWSVRGFWRKSKLGKVTWVRQHQRGGKGKAKPKEYEVITPNGKG